VPHALMDLPSSFERSMVAFRGSYGLSTLWSEITAYKYAIFCNILVDMCAVALELADGIAHINALGSQANASSTLTSGLCAVNMPESVLTLSDVYIAVVCSKTECRRVQMPSRD